VSRCCRSERVSADSLLIVSTAKTAVLASVVLKKSVIGHAATKASLYSSQDCQACDGRHQCKASAVRNTHVSQDIGIPFSAPRTISIHAVTHASIADIRIARLAYLLAVLTDMFVSCRAPHRKKGCQWREREQDI
jgi:hypothetical protein